MRIIVDNKIPYIKGALEPFAEVVYLPGSDTTPEVVKNADAIITRTRTICNEHLLKGSTVKMIATATIGYDHIDTDYCEANGIEWVNAPGCNSWSVAQYIMAALFHIANEKNLLLQGKTIGVIGVGNVGSKVAFLCETIGMKVLINDPPRERTEGSKAFSSLDQICSEADFISLHTPLTYQGIDKTYHLVDENFIRKLNKNPVFINSARGEVMDTLAIVNALDKNIISTAIIDCWENEPEIDKVLLDKAFISTPHIAGYSRDGKANGTNMSVQALSRKFKLGIDNWQCHGVELPESTLIKIDGVGKSAQQIIAEAVLATYPIVFDTKRLKNSWQTFEKQRGDYPVRREFPSYTIDAENVDVKILQTLSKMGFVLK